MSNFDQSRRIDLAKGEALLHDPTVPTHVKRKVIKARNVIIEQNQNPESNRLRHQLIRAANAGDQEAVESITENIKRSDVAQGYDRHKEGHLVDS